MKLSKKQIALLILGLALTFTAVIGFAAAALFFSGQLSPEEIAEIKSKMKQTPTDDWRLSRDKACPKAAALMKEDYFYSWSDDDSPFGNDDGADALAFYREWRNLHAGCKAEDSVEEVLHRLDIPLSDWMTIKPQNVIAPIGMHDDFVLTTGDHAIIAIAFGEILFDGSISKTMFNLADKALENEQELAKKWSTDNTREERLAQMRNVIKRACHE